MHRRALALIKSRPSFRSSDGSRAANLLRYATRVGMILRRKCGVFRTLLDPSVFITRTADQLSHSFHSASSAAA